MYFTRTVTGSELYATAVKLQKIMTSILVSDSLDGYRPIIRAEPTVARTVLIFDNGDEVLYCIVENLVSIIIL